LSETEVTQAQWKSVMGSNPSTRQEDLLPVHYISYLEAREFCRRLSKKESLVYRLPTEAEWENACRAGSQRRYSGGEGIEVLTRQGLTKESNPTPTSPQAVGKLAANAWGFFDMHGNVYEWCRDGFTSFNGDPVADPLVDPESSLRVARGGSYSSSHNTSRCAHRARFAAKHRAANLGFRVARELPPR
jgi:formylglycine-generating enzyme required for sulfatase activity